MNTNGAVAQGPSTRMWLFDSGAPTVYAAAPRYTEVTYRLGFRLLEFLGFRCPGLRVQGNMGFYGLRKRNHVKTDMATLDFRGICRKVARSAGIVACA